MLKSNTLHWSDGVAGQDEAELAALSQRTFGDKFRHLYSAEDYAAFIAESHSVDWYAAALANADYLVRIGRDETGKMAAYLVCSPLSLPADDAPEGAVELKRVYVDAAWQGHGLGSDLVNMALDWAKQCGAPAIYLSVFSENFGAQRLYERFGWSKVKEFWFPVGAHRDLEYLMEKRL